VTTYLYFTLFTPLVYWACLAQFFSSSKSLIFSYKPQDDSIDDNLSVPSANLSVHSHQLSFKTLKPDIPDFNFHSKALNSLSIETHVNDLNSDYFQTPTFSNNSIQNQNYI